LRIVKYDRQTLAMRRVQSETVDTDPIVWTNQRFIRWVRSIDLGEYADNLKGACAISDMISVHTPNDIGILFQMPTTRGTP